MILDKLVADGYIIDVINLKYYTKEKLQFDYDTILNMNYIK